MKLRSLTVLGAAALLAAPAAAPLARGQDPETGAFGGGGVVFLQDDALAPAHAEFLATEMTFDGTPVKGAPFSAEAITESVQVLGDGNRIVHGSRGMIYRDSEGRVRREQSLKGFGPWSSDETREVVIINDSVAGAHYVLVPDKHTARKLPATQIYYGKGVGSGSGKGVGKSTVVLAPATAAAGGSGASSSVVFTPTAEGGGVATAVAGDPAFVMAAPAPPPMGGQGLRIATAEPKDAKKESLGKKTIEGVEAEGTRSTITIAAGQIGNERDIEIVSESWYSPELKMVVMSRHSDPRFGETTYRLANVSRDEPARSLFEIPADYTVEDAGSPMRLQVRRELERREVEKKNN